MKCEVCNIENIAQVNIFTSEEQTTFIEKILTGAIDPYNLDMAMYLKMGQRMADEIMSGYGSKVSELQVESEERELLKDLIRSGYTFVAAKQYQLVTLIMGILDQPDRAAFMAKATEEFALYNVDYFTTELDSAFHQARSAREWLKFSDNG